MSGHKDPDQVGQAGPVLQLRRATRIHGEGPRTVRALVDADLVLHPGEFVAVMGPSGSGKSTLLHLAGGLDVPTSGQVLVEGTDLAGLTATGRTLLRRRAVGYVFQDFNLLPALTAAENVSFPLELDSWPIRRARQTACAVLAEVGVAELADRFPEDMSGGQAQRVAIARALVGPRRLLLADEPTGALDRARELAAEHTTLVRMTRPSYPYPWGGMGMLTPVALLTALAVAATTISVALARTQVLRDFATMHAVGATPRFLRRFTLTQAVVVLATGVPLGMLSGLALGTYQIAWNRRTGLGGA